MQINSLKDLSIKYIIDTLEKQSNIGHQKVFDSLQKNHLPEEINLLALQYILRNPQHIENISLFDTKTVTKFCLASTSSYSKEKVNVNGVMKNVLKFCTKLQVLDLSKYKAKTMENPLFDYDTPYSMSVQELDLHDTHLTENEYKHFKNLFPNLLKLNAKNCGFIKLEHLPITLESLDFSSKSISQEELKNFSKFLPHLKHLKARGVHLLSDLKYLPMSIEELNVSNCKAIPSSEFDNIHRYFPKLRKLNVSHTQVTTLRHIPSTVEELVLKNCKNLAAEEFIHLKTQAKDLKKLVVSCCCISSLEDLPNTIEELTLESCKLLNPKIKKSIKELFPNLKKLTLEDINIESPMDLPDSIQEIDFKLKPQTSVNAIKKLQQCPNLKKIRLTKADLSKVNQFSSSVEEVVLKKCQGLSSNVLKHSSGLKCLNLNKTEASLKDLPETLTTLILKRENPLKLEDLQQIHLPKLKKFEATCEIASLLWLSDTIEELNISQSANIPVDEFQKLKDAFPNLKKLRAIRSYDKLCTLKGLPKDLEILEIPKYNQIPQQELSEIRKSFPRLKINFI